ncbi:hypothetical protein BAUCODRAFT_79856 [Baudoinia panamericana UAMH 10762]|uniref:Diphthamide biosynthesis protein 4 n=1 Tax=Baudoinia panamericana (strain UAMH 10762) TaxID=717646 RepID=M2LBF5_BAUPA|nr:uncharacterized protein BAUCODRAFT_79856 [Baudoinia panamericana UAMH 10762]EMC91172.1 hypothetical protein BAUCODRAFT_79856 [Baudoinia panamericana UAMH 10762]
MCDYYAILGLEHKRSESLSAREVKDAYRRSLLQYHPDKTQGNRNGDAAISVDQMAAAYRVLVDPGLKAEYDRGLQRSSSHASSHLHHDDSRTGMEIVDLDTVAFDEQTQLWSRACRCGSAFIITEHQLEKNAEQGELIVSCDGCSLWLMILFNTEDTP